jgi:monovalent cation/hydrogen antiporter
VRAEELLLFVLAGVAVLIAVRWVADRTGLPAAALLTLVGVGYALAPGPNVTLDPELVLTLVLPPLLYSAALDASLSAIRRNLRTVVSLSVLLVLATALVVGVGFELLVPGATLAAGIALGAAVAPPDPVAALEGAEGGEIPLSPHYEAAVRLRRAVIASQRQELLHWRDVGRLPDESLRILERELDHEERLLPSSRAS